MDDPVTRYEGAVEALVRDPSPENDLAASRAHYDSARATCGSRRGGWGGTGRGG
ncbi:MAG: hypothetical protein AVDCRST_MAG12-1825 [uncultured Rubrobacteraceae bacterium]|uniref:Uncharacterized protein n=1 Tax=uncultured Rubrobacteraceae bacterium TaxID=349277 RepID=A0A6J4S0J1_9ACTN|nr:MAG: hypothetical protein AVDCRST_MAG12-1825 [uncultured Rubrobacteraceae bacterium]